MTNHHLHLGNCLDTLRAMPDNSVDSIVTDPPYGLSFMGKKWDYDVPSQDIWEECLRVLKPGGHLLAFAGTRTQHRMAVRIEDAGFEIRDMIAWVYGSGFPKSLDVSKAIDKLDATEAQLARRHQFCDWMRSTGITQPQLRDLFHSMQTFSTKDSCNTQASSYLYHAKQGPAVMPRYVMEVVRPYLSVPVPAWVEEMVDQRTVESENFKRREVVGTRVGVDTTKQRIACATSAQGLEKSTSREYNVTASHTTEAQQWQGWGTALKPALEPITVARKPFKGTVAGNVLAHGCGALNVDGCKVGDEERVNIPGGHRDGTITAGGSVGGVSGGFNLRGGQATRVNGRWPANFLHDGSQEVDDLLGGAARFFYCAKASRKDRNNGCEGVKTWENVDLKSAQAAAQKLQRDTYDIITQDQAVKEWSTTSFGKRQTEAYLMAIKSITETMTKQTTTSETLNCSAPLITKENILVAIKTVQESGLSLADFVEISNQLQQNTTNEKTVSALGAVAAVLKTLCEISSSARHGNIHSTVKPTDLMRYLVRLVTPPGGTVLDPFMGSGSTGKACVLEGFNFIGCEMDQGYLEIAKARIEAAQNSLNKDTK